MCGIAETFNAVGTLVQGQQQAAEARAIAAWSESEANYLSNKATWDRARRSEQNQAQIGSLLAQRAGSGVALDGSALDSLSSMIFLTRADERDVELGGKLAAARGRRDAALSRFNATQALTSAAFGAGTTLLSGARTTKNWWGNKSLGALDGYSVE